MANLIKLFLFLTLGLQVYAADPDDLIQPPTHLAQSASTLRPGHVAWDPYPGSNPIAQGGFVFYTVSVGLTQRLQAGTSPAMWLLNSGSAQNGNLGLKYWFYKGEVTQASFGLFNWHIRMQAPNLSSYITIFLPALNNHGT